jgi:hypothetical protein
MINNKVVKVLPRIWVQFNGLPNELCDFFIIWVVGSILGVTKDVDMVFTRKHDNMSFASSCVGFEPHSTVCGRCDW